MRKKPKNKNSNPKGNILSLQAHLKAPQADAQPKLLKELANNNSMIVK
jgi:hypothetical protein